MTIEERLEKIEKKIRRNSILLVAVVLLAVLTIVAWIAAHKDVIKATSFDLVDENGKTRAVLGMGKDGPALGLLDDNGTTRAGLALSKDGPGLELGDENGKARVSLIVLKDGPALGLLDEKGKTRFSLAVLKDGAGLSLLDESGKTRATLGVSGTITADGKLVTYPESSLRLFKGDGTVLWQAPP